MYVKKDKVERIFETASQKFQEKHIQEFTDMGFVEAFQLLLNEIAKESQYAEGEKIKRSDLSRIKDAVAIIHNEMRKTLIEENKNSVGRPLNQYDIFPAMVAVNDYLYAMAMKTLGSPYIPESFGQGVQDLIRDIAHETEFNLKKNDYAKTSIDRRYEKQRWLDAKDVRKSTDKIQARISNKEASSLQVAQYAGEYYALKRRQEGHGKWWIFFHGKENEARTKLLSEMEKTLKTILNEDDELDKFDPEMIARLYNKQNLTGRANEIFRKGIAERNGMPSIIIGNEPTSTVRADKEIDEPDQKEFEFEEEMRMPLEFGKDAFKESEPVEMTYETKVDNKIVSNTVIHDDGHEEVDFSKFNPKL